MPNSATSIEQIIKESRREVKSDIIGNLRLVPADDLADRVTWLGSIIKVMFYEEKVDGRWATAEMVGYTGRSEFSNELREVWNIRFRRPLPPSTSLFLKDSGEMFTISVDGTAYAFNKLDGSYLGQVLAGTA